MHVDHDEPGGYCYPGSVPGPGGGQRDGDAVHAGLERAQP